MSGQAEEDLGSIADQLLTLALLIVRSARDGDNSELTPAHRAILSLVVNHGPQTISELARSQQVSLPSISKHVQRLEAMGYLVRKSDTEDRRISRVDYTSKTWTSLEKSKKNQTSNLARQMAKLSPTDIERLQQVIPILKKLVT